MPLLAASRSAAARRQCRVVLLTQLLLLRPKIDPALAAFDEEEDDEGEALPTRNSEEFKPFIRRLPEFKFWLSAQRATLLVRR